GAVDLAVTGLPAQVRGHLVDPGDAGGGDGVALGLQTARDVHRGAAVPPGGARVEEADGVPGRAQHQVVVVHELGGGEAVVQLDQVEVGGVDPATLVGLAGGVASEGVEVRQR